MENSIGNVRQVTIEDEMRGSYLEYAMSVIIQRALPDVRDGLKPVHRRILHAMNELGLGAGARYRKSAAVVGEVLGKYHPHGDVAVYDTIVRMAQDFSMRSPLIDGQGNFGSVDGDSAAAMRYTEVRMAAIAEELLTDIDRATVDWMDNYDGTQREPRVLPAKLPNLLLNGMSGIAVGMATSIPPHNLRELCRGIILLIELKRDAQVDAVLNALFKHTPMQSAISANMLALVDGQPSVLALEQMMRHYLAHRRDVVTRRTRHDLEAARRRAHVLEGLSIAITNVDAVIALIRATASAEVALAGLMERFALSETQRRA